MGAIDSYGVDHGGGQFEPQGHDLNSEPLYALLHTKYRCSRLHGVRRFF